MSLPFAVVAEWLTRAEVDVTPAVTV